MMLIYTQMSLKGPEIVSGKRKTSFNVVYLNVWLSCPFELQTEIIIIT